jgi:hypothetical protein
MNLHSLNLKSHSPNPYKTLKNNVLALVAGILTLSLLGNASALTLEGKTLDGWPKNARLGIFTVLPSGKTTLELGSVALENEIFSLELSKITPNEKSFEKSLNSLLPESITWAGVVGMVKLSSTPKAVELKLMVYSDTNNNNKRDEDETPLEPVLQLGRANLILFYVDSAVQIQADKGFNINLVKGFNAITIESGRVVKGTVLDKVVGLQLEKP